MWFLPKTTSKRQEIIHTSFEVSLLYTIWIRYFRTCSLCFVEELWPYISKEAGNFNKMNSLSTFHVFQNTCNTLQWRHNERDDVANHQRLEYLLNRLFRRWSKKTGKLRLTGFCEGISPITGGFPSQGASNAENGFIWWRHHEMFHSSPMKMRYRSSVVFTN